MSKLLRLLPPNVRDWWGTLPFQPFAQRFALQARKASRNVPGDITINGFLVHYTDVLSCYIEYKDIFIRKIYHFSSKKANPLIIDGGGCIGMSLLYFKQVFPDARIICFEPDPDLMQVLSRNITTNQLADIALVQAGLAGQAGTVAFHPDGVDGGRIVEGNDGHQSIATVCLSDYIREPVDFLKLNIEGSELPVLQEVEASGKMEYINELVLEYHGWPGEPQRLGEILRLLERNGFRYLLHDFDAETSLASKPPFHLTTETTWFCLVYARRMGS